jgi:hypothetical protein
MKNPAPSYGTQGHFRDVVLLNFLRVSVALAGIISVAGAAMVVGFTSSPAHPRPGLAVLLFVPVAGLVGLICYGLNWLLSLAPMFVVRDSQDAIAAISSAVALCRERTAPVMAVGTWTGAAHLIVLFAATSVIALPLGLAGILPWRVVALLILLLTMAYFAVADWLYTARLAGYVCIAEMPDVAPVPLLPSVPPDPTPLQTTIDRDEPILSDLPNLILET